MLTYMSSIRPGYGFRRLVTMLEEALAHGLESMPSAPPERVRFMREMEQRADSQAAPWSTATCSTRRLFCTCRSVCRGRADRPQTWASLVFSSLASPASSIAFARSSRMSAASTMPA
jgi:hypothetical protein